MRWRYLFVTQRMPRFKSNKLFQKIQRAYIDKLGADQHYVGVFTKNPNSNFWRTFVFNVPKYTLDYLADFADFIK